MRHAKEGAHDLHDSGVMEDLVEWVEIIVGDACVARQLDPVLALAVAADAAGSFEDLLVNHYGED